MDTVIALGESRKTAQFNHPKAAMSFNDNNTQHNQAEWGSAA
jgi:hypothetical protein